MPEAEFSIKAKPAECAGDVNKSSRSEDDRVGKLIGVFFNM
jgi:hypothetical protein